MRLLHLDVRGFGRLRGRIDLDGDVTHGLGLVLERNEAGKSTLAAAIRAALYGLDGDRRRFRGTITDLDRHRPWSEGPYGLVLTLQRGSETLTIDRDFARDTVRVLRGAEDVTDRYRQGHDVAVGEGITGLREEQFVASVFVGQGDIVWTDPSRLTEALQRVADSQSGTSTAATAIEALDRALDRYQGVTIGQGKVGTEIKRTAERAAAAREELARLEARQGELEASVEALDALRHEDARDTEARRVLRARRLRTESNALEALLRHDTELGEQIAKEQARLDGWADADARLDEMRSRVDQLRRDLDADGRDVAALREVARESANLRAGHEAELERLGVGSVPDDDAFDRLHDAVRRLKEAVAEHEDYLRRLDGDRRAMEEAGHRLPEVLSLANDFEELSDADRVRLVGRTSRRTDRDERRRDLESARDHARHDVDAIAAAQDGRRRTGWILLAVALACAVGVFVAGDRIPVARVVQFAMPAVFAIAGLAVSLTASRHRDGDRTRALERIEQVTRDLEALDAETAEEERAWNEMAARLEIDPARIEERYATWSRVESGARSASVHRARADEWKTARERALETLREFEEHFGEAALETVVDEWIDRARRARELATRIDAARAEQRQHDARRQRIEADAFVKERELRRVFTTLDLDGADGDASLDDLFGRYDRMVEAARARRETREHRIPSLERQRLDDARRHAHRERQAAITAELEALAFDGDPGAPLGETDYDQALAELDERAARRRDRETHLRGETEHFLREYESRAPELRAEIEAMERAHHAAVEYEAAVTLARDTLGQLGQETHRVWATALQRTASDFLRRMGSDVSEIRFDESLGVQLRQQDRVITGTEAPRVLSAGALDAVFLAARFAVARFLGGDEDPLPLILDDPLANADDRRLLDTLRLLVDAVAPEQQVLLMACQHSRYDWAADALERDGALRRLELETD